MLRVTNNKCKISLFVVSTGLVTSRDVDFIPPSKYATTKIVDVMVPFEKLITGDERFTLEHAYDLLESEKKGFLKCFTSFASIFKVFLSFRTWKSKAKVMWFFLK